MEVLDFDIKIKRVPLRIQNFTRLLHPILSAQQGSGLFPIEIKRIVLDGFFWKLQLPLKKGIFLPSTSGIYIHLHPLPFPSYLVAITLISRQKLTESFFQF